MTVSSTIHSTNHREGLLIRDPHRTGGDCYLPSEGYADDTAVMTNTLVALAAQHGWVLYFMQFYHLQLNVAKCELIGRHADGSALTREQARVHGLIVDGTVITPLALDHTVRYLGVHLCYTAVGPPSSRRRLRRSV